jgi:hypothetical protein
MNAMLQQLFCIAAFRRAILLADDHRLPSLAELGKLKAVDDNLLHQVQLMFAHLEISL